MSGPPPEFWPELLGILSVGVFGALGCWAAEVALCYLADRAIADAMREPKEEPHARANPGQ